MVKEEPAKRMGNYSTEGNYEFANITDKPLGDTWDVKGANSNHINTTLAHHESLLAQV